MHSVDISPVYSMLNDGLSVLVQGAIVAACGWATWAIHKYLTPYIGKQNEKLIANMLDTALQNGVVAGMHKLNAWESVHSDVNVKGQVAAWAAQYAVDHAPQAVNSFGYSLPQLADMALARIPVPPPSDVGTTGAKVPPPAPVEVKPLAPAT